jgi:ABC-type transport system involved in multi-copper enzyme maturation permease subunit
VIDALRFEWVRLHTIRSTYWLLASALVLNVATAFLVALLTRHHMLTNVIVGAVVTAGGANPPVPLAAVFVAAIGIFATGHEYAYGTIQPTLTAIPQRSTVLAAKTIVVAVVGAGFAVVSMVVDLAAGVIFWHEVPDLTIEPLAGALPGYLVLTVLWAVLGTQLGQLFRSVAAPLVVVLVIPLVVEQLIFRMSNLPALDWLQPAVKFLPFLAGSQLTSLSGEAAGSDATQFGLFDRWISGSIFAAFIAAVLAAAWLSFNRRDA